MIERNTTGRMRYRQEGRLFKPPLLVLQVEVHAKGYSIEYPGTAVDVDEKYWRDARMEDFIGRHSVESFTIKTPE